MAKDDLGKYLDVVRNALPYDVSDVGLPRRRVIDCQGIYGEPGFEYNF